MIKLICKLTGGHKWDENYHVLTNIFTNKYDVIRVCKKCGHIETISVSKDEVFKEKFNEP